MDYKEKYNKLVEAVKVLQEANPSDEGIQNWVNDNVPELRESENERTRKEIISFLQLPHKQFVGERKQEKWIAWLEKQDEHKKFRDSIQIGDRVTRNEDGVLVNLSQLNRVAKKDKKQGKQKPVEWKQENREELTEFENAMMHIGGSFFGENAGLDPNDTDTIKEQAELLLELAPKTEWSEEDERAFHHVLSVLEEYGEEHPSNSKFVCNWLKSIKARMGGDKV